MHTDVEFAATRLTGGQLDELRQQAQEKTRRNKFIDPVALRRVERFMSGRHRDAWASVVLGRPFPGLLRVKTTDVVLLDLAAEAEPNPPEPPREPRYGEPGYEPSPEEKARRARVEVAVREWEAVRELLPVPVTVEHNYRSRHHYELYVQGVEHIVLGDPLSVGRLHRSAGDALCETPANSRMLFDGPTPEDRYPTCQECIRIAYRITGRAPSKVLLRRGR